MLVLVHEGVVLLIVLLESMSHEEWRLHHVLGMFRVHHHWRLLVHATWKHIESVHVEIVLCVLLLFILFNFYSFGLRLFFV